MEVENETQIQELARRIGIAPSILSHMVLKPDTYYREFWDLKKKKKRLIRSPNTSLKGVQRWLCQEFLSNLKVHESCHGFVPGRSILTNALMHVENRYVLVVDLQDFFHSINEERILSCLENEFRLINIEPEFAKIISKLATFENILPQGSPLSPLVSNIVFKEFDEKISRIALMKGVVYTRYADDMSFSSNDSYALKEVKEKVYELIGESGVFVIREPKTRYLGPKRRVSITGLNINEGVVKVPKKTKKQVRAMIYNKIVLKHNKPSWDVINGYISFISGVEPDYKMKIKKYVIALKKKPKFLDVLVSGEITTPNS